MRFDLAYRTHSPIDSTLTYLTLFVLSRRICSKRIPGHPPASGSAPPVGRPREPGVFAKIGGWAGTPFPGGHPHSTIVLAGPAREASPQGTAVRNRTIP